MLISGRVWVWGVSDGAVQPSGSQSSCQCSCAYRPRDPDHVLNWIMLNVCMHACQQMHRLQYLHHAFWRTDWWKQTDYIISPSECTWIKRQSAGSRPMTMSFSGSTPTTSHNQKPRALLYRFLKPMCKSCSTHNGATNKKSEKCPKTTFKAPLEIAWGPFLNENSLPIIHFQGLTVSFGWLYPLQPLSKPPANLIAP